VRAPPTRTFWAAGLLVAALAAFARTTAAADADDRPRPPRMRASRNGSGSTKPLPLARPLVRGGGDVTRCAACHAVEGWEKVRFNHDPTGFPLRGAHVAVACGSCHPRDFETPVADTCAGCHRDRHRGEFGTRCEGCHDDQSWRPFFEADAHRRTGFPLVGKHGLIPCQQCHGDMRDQTFLRAPVGCVSCHRPDYDQTRVTSIDHTAAGFSLECQTCHSTWRFWPARLEAHGACFRIASGSHHGIRCLGCHTSLPNVTFTGACATGTFTCSGCHTHECARSDAQHTNVMGYQCTDAKCYECHKLTGQ
jgi:hypothetical protein